MGQIQLRKAQLAIEATPGTALAATRQLVGTLTLEDDRTRDFRDDEQRGSFGGGNVTNDFAYASKGKYDARVTANELPHWLALAMRGDVTPTTPSGTVRLWTFTAPLTTVPDVKTATLKTGDNEATSVVNMRGAAVKKISIKGGDKKPLMLSCDLVGRHLGIGSLQVLTQPATEDLKSLLSKWYIDPASGTLGATQLTGTVYDWEWVMNTGVDGDFTEDGSLDMQSLSRGTPSYELNITAKWNSQTVAQWTNFDDTTTGNQLIRMENSGSVIATTYSRRLRIDGSWRFTDFKALSGDKNGLTLCTMKLRGVEDSGTYAKLAEVEIQNTLTALGAAA